MKRIHTIPAKSWDSTFNLDRQRSAVRALEEGQVLHFPALAFTLSEKERHFLTPAILGKAKNVSYNPATSELGGSICDGREADELKSLIARYSNAAQGLLGRLLAHYGSALTRERTSLRTAEIAGRVTSWRKDDSRLHVDSFPSAPTQGRRILRIFCNVNPQGRPRTWRAGEPFAVVAKQFWSRLPAPHWIKQQLLSWLRVTKEFRSNYDHYMLQLHDAMKMDVDYQRSAQQETINFPAGSAWACFTDQVSHAAMAGQHQFEQTFSLPVDAMQNRNTAPLAVLEKLAGRALLAENRRQAA